MHNQPSRMYPISNSLPLHGVHTLRALEQFTERRADMLDSYFQLIAANIVNDTHVRDKRAVLHNLVQEYAHSVRGNYPASPPSGMADTNPIIPEHKGLPFEMMTALLKITKSEDGHAFGAADFAYTPDLADPTTWELRLAETPGSITEKQLNFAVGDSGELALVPAADLPAVKRRVRSEYARLGIADVPDAVKALIDPDAFDLKTAIKRENGMDFPPRDYAYVPDPKQPATWRLRLAESPGKITRPQLVRAAILLRSERTSGVPVGALNAVRRRVRAEFKRLGVPDGQLPPSVREGARVLGNTAKQQDFTIWKSGEQYYWMGVYSNKYRDDDYPPEIISEKSHRAFTYLANNGIVPMPELWHWHVKGTRWGIATMLDYVDGFAVAIGTVDEGHEKEAEAVAQRDDIGMSHGMFTRHILRNADDPSILDFHITHEVSDLLLDRAANKLTSFVVFNKEADMPLATDVKKYLAGVGLDETQILAIETGLQSAAKQAEEAGLESKNAPPPEPQTPPPADPAPVVTPTVDEVVKASELADVMKEVITPIGEAIASLSQRIAQLETKLATQDDILRQEAAKQIAETPRASLRDIVAQSLIGNKDLVVDGRTTLAKGPRETPATHTDMASPFLANVIANGSK